MQSLRTLLFLSLLLIPALTLRAEDAKPALTFENLGLKNNYRVIFDSWDEANHFASGAFEISDNTEDKVHTRIPFTADIKESKDKATQTLTVRCTAMDLFFPPANKKDPYPPLTWKITGLKTKEAKLKAGFWTFGKSAWQLDEMEFEKPEK